MTCNAHYTQLMSLIDTSKLVDLSNSDTRVYVLAHVILILYDESIYLSSVTQANS